MRIISPMLATLCEEPSRLAAREYLIEHKLDGERAILYREKGEFRLVGRNLRDITHHFPDVERALVPELQYSCILDGEIVCRGGKLGTFQYIQQRMTRKHNIEEYAEKYPATFVPFDLLGLNGRETTGLALDSRKYMLGQLRIPHTIEFIYDGDVVELLQRATAEGWEGLMAKHAKHAYREGSRSKSWLKLKARKPIRVVVVGVNQGYGKRDGTFGSLIVADPTTMRVLGEVGTGWTDEELIEFRHLLNALDDHDDAHARELGAWFTVKPVLKILVTYLEMTNDGQLRHPAFVDLVE